MQLSAHVQPDFRFHALAHTILTHCDNEYAKSYARYMVTHIRANDYNALVSQSLYILNNIKHWRGPLAQSVRNDFKKLIKHYS